MNATNIKSVLAQRLKFLQEQPEKWEIVIRSTMVEVGTDYKMSDLVISTGMYMAEDIEKMPIRMRAILHEHSSPIYMADNIITDIEQRIREVRDEDA